MYSIEYYCKSCDKETLVNDMGYCQNCNEEIETFRAHPEWRVRSVDFIDNPKIRGMRISNGYKRQELCDEFHGEINA